MQELIIEVHHHFIEENVQYKEVELLNYTSRNQNVDVLTKPLRKEKLVGFRNNLGLK